MTKIQKFSSLLYTIQPIDKIELKGIFEELTKVVSIREVGYRFKEVNLFDGYLTGTIIHRIPTVIKEFDAQTNSLIDRHVILFLENEFAIDGINKTLEFFCATKQVPKARNALRKYLSNKSIDFLNLSPFKVFPIININFDDLEILNLTIVNYRHSTSIIGRYVATIKSNEEGIELLNEYKNDVVKAKFRIVFQDEPVELELSNNGRLGIICKEDLHEEVFFKIKQLIRNEK